MQKGNESIVLQNLQITKQCDYLTKWIKDVTIWDCKTEINTCSWKRWRACKNKSACSENLEQQGKDEQQWSVFVGCFAMSLGWF